MWGDCDCRCEGDSECFPQKLTCAFPTNGVVVRCIANWSPIQTWHKMPPAKDTVFTGICFPNVSDPVITDEDGRIWNYRATELLWHVWELVHTAADPLRDCSTFTDGVAIAVGDNGIVLRSTDGGATWAAVVSGTTDNLQSVRTRGLNGLIVGDNGTILRTTDSGATWVSVSSGTATNLIDVSFASASRAWAVGGSGVVLRSADGGVSWATISGVTGTITAVAATGADLCYVFTTGANAKAWKTTDAGANWTPDAKSGAVDIIDAADFIGTQAYYSSRTNGDFSDLSLVRCTPSIAFVWRSLRVHRGNVFLVGTVGLKGSRTSPCGVGGMPKSWTVTPFSAAVPFLPCSLSQFGTSTGFLPGVVIQDIEKVADCGADSCHWESVQRLWTCDAAGYFGGSDKCKWSLDVSGSSATLTFTTDGGLIASYLCGDFEPAVGNLFSFDAGSSNTGPTGHEELWLCPGDTTDPLCYLCDDRDKWPKCWTIEFPPALQTAYEYHSDAGVGGWFAASHSECRCDPGSSLAVNWPYNLGVPWPSELEFEMWIQTQPYCDTPQHVVTVDFETRACLNASHGLPGNGICIWWDSDFPNHHGGVGFRLTITKSEFLNVVTFEVLVTFATGHGVSGFVSVRYFTDLPGDCLRIDCTIPVTLALDLAWPSHQVENPASTNGWWVPNHPFDDLPATLTLTPCTPTYYDGSS